MNVPLHDAMQSAGCHYVGGCGAEATTHILLDTDEWENVLACDEHAAWFGDGRKWVKADDHAIGAVCGWAGVIWSMAEKRCYLADGDLESLTAADLVGAVREHPEPEPVGVPTDPADGLGADRG